MTHRVALSFAFLLACGDDAPPAAEQTDPDTGPTVTRDAGVRPTTDAGRSEPKPLAVAIGARGTTRTCGDCAVLTAQPSGGAPPYQFVWSDAKLKGPGPHEVCDAQAARYEVTVSDSTRNVVGDLGSEVGVEAKANVELPCSPPDVDAGTGFSGCKVLFNASILDIFNPGGAKIEAAYSCLTLDGGAGVPANEVVDGGTPVAQYLQLPEPMSAGTPYSFAFELLLPLTIGGDLRMELYGSESGCSPDERLGEVRIVDGVITNACITPTRAYDKILARPGDASEAPVLAFSLGVSMTLCSSCDKAP